MTEDEQRALRLLLREEVNAAVFASEQRVGEGLGRLDKHMNQFEDRFGTFDEHMNQFEDRFGTFDEHMARFEDRLGTLDEYMPRFDERLSRFEDRLGSFEQKTEDRFGKLEDSLLKIQVDVSEITSVLNVASRVINEIQAAQVALELKVEDNSRSLKRDMQSLTETVHNFSRRFIEINRQTYERILLHERTPIDRAHPHPGSAT